jgi:transposase
MDNHGAHRTQLTKELLQKLRIEPVFMSSNSPEFNSIETLWAGVKKRFHDALNKFVKVHKLTQN